MDYVVVVSLALFLSIILAKLVGGLLPLGAKKLGFDPAIMANPFLSTIVDCCSLLIYFQIATVVVPLVYELTNQKFPAVMPAAGNFVLRFSTVGRVHCGKLTRPAPCLPR